MIKLDLNQLPLLKINLKNCNKKKKIIVSAIKVQVLNNNNNKNKTIH